jgi:replicative DNA helicase
LGACLLSPVGRATVVQALKADDFSVAVHQSIYGAVLALDESGNVDPITVSDWLRARGEERAGDLDYLLSCINSCSTPTVPDALCNIVKDKSKRRQLWKAIGQARAVVEDETIPLEEVQSQAEELVLGVREPVKSDVTAQSWADMLETRAAQRKAGIDTSPRIKSGISTLDNNCVRLRRGRLTTVAADTGIGKSVMATKLLRESALRLNQRAVAWLGEMDKDEMYERVAAAELGINYEAIQDAELDDKDLQRIKAFAKTLDEAPLDILDEPMTVRDIRSYCRYVAHTKGKVDLVVIDYLLLLKELNQETENSSRRDLRIGIVVWNLIALARELDCHVVLVHQFNREKSKRTTNRPRLSDLKESSAIEQHSYNVLLMYRPDRDDALEPDEREKYKGWLEVIVAKARGGKVGSKWLNFKGDTQDITMAHRPWPGDGTQGALPLPGQSAKKVARK